MEGGQLLFKKRIKEYLKLVGIDLLIQFLTKTCLYDQALNFSLDLTRKETLIRFVHN